jgi:hypothetical protein
VTLLGIEVIDKKTPLAEPRLLEQIAVASRTRSFEILFLAVKRSASAGELEARRGSR